MMRNEYLTSLNQVLDFLDAETRQSTLAFYAELLDDREEEGMSEEDAVAAMEDVNIIAARMRQEQKNAIPKEDITNAPPVPCTITYGEKDLSSLTVSVLCRSVVLEASHNHELTLQYAESEAHPLTFTEENGRLTLTEDKPLNTSGFTLFGFNLSNVLDSLFRGAPQIDSTLYIKVPCNMLLDLDIKTTNGRISAAQLTGMGKISLTSSNSSITLESLKCEELRAHTSNGRITLTNSCIAKSFVGKSSNGSIVAEYSTANSDISLNTSNSRIRAFHVHAGNEMRLHTSNGSIHLENSLFEALDAHSSNGNISGTVPGAMQDYRIDSRTSNGSNTLPPHQDGPKPLSVKTSNGHIRIYFENNTTNQA
ncbi:MAG: DUF4097 family beta strand repeat protein [Oscillospiraceae bacterium]|nr:DUF4097 family beta strand repeat protein [Oscillospiraceae bacterium]